MGGMTIIALGMAIAACIGVYVLNIHVARQTTRLVNALDATSSRIDLHSKVLQQTLESIEKLESQQ